MRISSAAASDIGRVRDRNEDSFREAAPYFAVADGMGGHRGGEVASRLALTTIDALREKGDATLGEQVREANRAVHERARTDAKVAGMGTTLTVARVVEGTLQVAHVGDSRAYLLRDHDLQQLTTDHTLVQRLVDIGDITAEEALTHPQRNVLLRVLGTEPSVEVDEHEVALRVGDRVLLCSDGLTAMLDDERIRRVLASTDGHPDVGAARLVAEANEAGGVDNITVIVIDVLDDGGGAA